MTTEELHNGKAKRKSGDPERSEAAWNREDFAHLLVLARAVLRYRGRLAAAFASSLLVAVLSVGTVASIKPVLDLIFGATDYVPPVAAQVESGALRGEMGLPGFPPETIQIQREGNTVRFRAEIPSHVGDDPEAEQAWLDTVYLRERDVWLRESASAQRDGSEEAIGSDRLRELLDPLYLFLARRARQHKLHALAAVALLIVAITLAKGVVTYSQEYLTNWIGRRVVADLRQELYDHITRMRLEFFQRKRVGGLLSYLTVDVELFGNSTMAVFGRMLQEPLLILGMITFLLYAQPYLTLLYGAVIPFLGWIMTSFGKRIRRARRKSQDAVSTMSAITQETLSGIRVVRAFQMEGTQREKFSHENLAIFRSFMKVIRARALSSPLMEVLASLGVAAVLLTGGYFVVERRDMAPSSFIVYLIGLGSLYQPVKRLNKAYESVQQGMAGADRIFDILDRPIPQQQNPGAERVHAFDEELAFQAVTHRYAPDSPPALEDISLVIPRGQVTALVGPSGAGKSTLAGLVPRLFDPSAGTIHLDGRETRDLMLEDLRGLIGLVPQEVCLFHDTVKNNVTCGQQEPSEERVIAALRDAQAWGFVKELPEGLETLVGERATLLSGGQAQRLAIARAFYRNPPILILDEATSSLDSASEDLVRAALDRLMEERTVLVIAHRLSTVIRADQIVVLERGKIVGRGRHSELLETCALYKELYDLQVS